MSRRAAALAASVVAAGALVSIGGPAGAFPQPTIGQVQHKLAGLNSKAAKLGQEYDQVLQQLALASQRLRLLNSETARYRSTFDAMRAEIGRIAAVAYEQGGADSPVALLTSGSPQQVLNQSSILTELSAANSAQVSQYVAASRQLLSAQQAASQARQGILQLKHSLGKRLAVLNTLKSQQEALLAQLTPAQQGAVGPGGGGSGDKYHGPTKTQAEKAVAFAYSQIGCPYYYGGTGPCRAPGFDCSGLMMAAWGYAGIQIPRVSYDQMSALPAVSIGSGYKYLEPGDILGFAGNSHVGMYVGGGYLIDAPVPGQYVEKVALSGWYAQELDGAVRP
ncbi:MAG TPA: NlpC/P60 family protein [Streptosporangiaceae bacterium]|nr:NlpC/P60 family protein [Streptosporangiaceae bacterium]